MTRKMSDFSAPTGRIEECIELLGSLAEVLEHNGGFKADEPGENPAMLSVPGEDAVVRAMRVIARSAHAEFCKLATDLGIPQ